MNTISIKKQPFSQIFHAGCQGDREIDIGSVKLSGIQFLDFLPEHMVDFSQDG
jgi:hypothetical protein